MNAVTAINEFNAWAKLKGLNVATTSFLRTVLSHHMACANAHIDAQRARQAEISRVVTGVIAGQIIGEGC